MHYSEQLLPLIASGVLLGVLLILMLLNLAEPVAHWLAAVYTGSLVWTVGYIFELASVGLHTKLIWADVQFLAGTPLILVWFLSVRNIVGRPSLRRGTLIALWSVVAALIIVMLLNPAGLFRVHPTLDYSGPIPVVAADYGLAYYLGWVPFEFGIMLATIVVLVRASCHTLPVYRERSVVLLVATLIPVVAGALFVAELLPWRNYNPAMASIAVSALLLGYASVRYRLIDLQPLARDAVVQGLADPVIIVDGLGRLVDYNDAAVGALPEVAGAAGRRLAEVVAARPALAALLEPEEAPAGEAPGAAVDARPVIEVRRTPTADLTSFAVSVTPVNSRSGRPVGQALVLHDVTERCALLAELRRLATTDEVTGLLTRRHFMELAEQELARAARHDLPLAMLVVDLDRFKLVNDVYGHAAGDAVLGAIGATFRHELRAFDLVGRYGGDELCALLPHLPPGEAEAVAERLRAAVAGMSVWHDEELLHVTVSIGLATVEDATGVTLAPLIAAADGALLRAKRRGRDRVIAAGSPRPERRREAKDR